MRPLVCAGWVAVLCACGTEAPAVVDDLDSGSGGATVVAEAATDSSTTDGAASDASSPDDASHEMEGRGGQPGAGGTLTNTGGASGALGGSSAAGGTSDAGASGAGGREAGQDASDAASDAAPLPPSPDLCRQLDEAWTIEQADASACAQETNDNCSARVDGWPFDIMVEFQSAVSADCRLSGLLSPLTGEQPADYSSALNGMSLSVMGCPYVGVPDRYALIPTILARNAITTADVGALNATFVQSVRKVLASYSQDPSDDQWSRIRARVEWMAALYPGGVHVGASYTFTGTCATDGGVDATADANRE